MQIPNWVRDGLVLVSATQRTPEHEHTEYAVHRRSHNVPRCHAFEAHHPYVDAGRDQAPDGQDHECPARGASCASPSHWLLPSLSGTILFTSQETVQ